MIVLVYQHTTILRNFKYHKFQKRFVTYKIQNSCCMISSVKYSVLICMLFLPVLVCGQKNKEKTNWLVRFCLNDHEEECGYINHKGDTVIHAGIFTLCLTDTIREFGVVLKPETGFIGIDRKGKFLFNIFHYDNGPDFLSEGLFRIKKKGKIGFADPHGKVVIKPKYDCAYPFENGKARVSFQCKKSTDHEHEIWKSDAWFYINRKGKLISN